jgi:hypothetical protein
MDEQSELTRRGFARVAAGAFALGVAGLYLPALVDDAAAREGALGGQLGGRRGKDRRGRDKPKRRDRGNGKNGQPNNGPRSGGPRAIDVAVRVRNLRDAPVQAQGWIGGWSTNDDKWTIEEGWDWSMLAAKPATGPQASKDFVGRFREVAVRVGTSHAVHCYLGAFGLVGAAIWTGGWGTAGHDPGASLLTYNDELRVDSSISAAGITVTRVADSDTHKWYVVDLT